MDVILSIIAIIISVISCGFTVYTFTWTAQRDKKQATLDAYNRLQNEAFDQLNLYMPARIKEISKHPTSEEYKEISGYIARIEHFCVGVNTGIYNKKVVYQLAHGYLDSSQIRNRINPIINRKNRDGEKDYYENTHIVLKWMDDISKNENK